MTDLIYKDLCYKVNGLAFEIFNTLGGELREKIYADAFEELLKREKIKYRREVYYPVLINGKVISKNYFDFVIDDILMIEIKKGSRDYRQVCTQLFQYLKTSNLKLGLVIRFTKDGARIKRVPNLY